MNATIHVVTGPAGSGKTARMLQKYRLHLQADAERLEIGRGLWLTPTHHSAAFVREHLLTDEFTACFDPQVFTFSGFADRVLRDSPASAALLPPTLQRMLVRDIVTHLRESGRLTHFANIAGTSGFVDQVITFLSELKRGEIWPEDFERIVTADRPHPRDVDLAAIYHAYQQHLHELDLYDSEGRFWSARDQLSQGHWGAFADLSFVVVDGFTDFTRTQYEILHLLAERVDEMSLTLPLDDPAVEPPPRADLFAKPAAALEQLRERVEVTTEAATGEGPSAAAAFGTIAGKLFQNPREIVPSPDGDGATVMEAIGQQGEVRAMAAEIKSLLAAGAVPSDIVVVFRSLADYADHVHEVFTAAGIPHAGASSEALSGSPIVKALMAVLQVAADDWSYARLRAVLENNYFCPDWPEFAERTAVRDVAAQLRRWQLRGGRWEILKRLHRAVQPPGDESGLSSARRKKREADRQSAAAALSLLERFEALLEPLQASHTWRGWAETLVRIGRDIRLDPRSLPAAVGDRDNDVRRRDLDAWLSLENLLYAAAAFDERLPGGGKKFDLRGIIEAVTDIVHRADLRHRETAAGKVRILDATQARNLDVPYLFIGGLTETGFPRRRGEDCFFSEAERRDFNGRGLALDHQSSRTQDEMLLFYGVVTRARRKLVCSFPAMSPSGQPLLPSPYLLALRQLFAEDAVTVKTRQELDPVPKGDELISPADLRIVALEKALNNDASWLRTIYETPAAEPVVRAMLAATTMAEHRFNVHGFTEYEGIVGNKQLQDVLREHYSTDYEFSATSLESYANCPFKFFVSHVLNVGKLEEPEIKTDHRRRGNVVHDILARMYQQFVRDREADGSIDPHELAAAPEFFARFDELLREQIRSHPDDPQLQRVLSDIEATLLSEWGAEYASQWADYVKDPKGRWEEPPLPAVFETTFGRSSFDDTPQQHDSLVLGVAHREVRVGGRIDRIDVGRAGGRPAFVVVDYKTGSSTKHTAKKVEAGERIQLPLYAMAVERLGLVGGDAVAMGVGYWFVKEKGFKVMLDAATEDEGELTASEAWQRVQEILEENVPKLAAGIRKGEFPVFNHDTSCTTNCEFSTVCRVGQIRALAEIKHKTWNLEHL